MQLLLAPNYSKESASELASGLLTTIAQSPPVSIDAEARFFRIDGRVIADIGAGTISALFKTFQWPATVVDGVEKVLLEDPIDYEDQYTKGTKQNYHTFGVYFDLTAVENLGVSLGYTGFLPTFDASGVDNVLWSGIDLRAT